MALTYLFAEVIEFLYKNITHIPIIMLLYRTAKTQAGVIRMVLSTQRQLTLICKNYSKLTDLRWQRKETQHFRNCSYSSSGPEQLSMMLHNRDQDLIKSFKTKPSNLPLTFLLLLGGGLLLLWQPLIVLRRMNKS